MDEDEIDRLYGPWTGRTPVDAAELLRDYDGLWWIAAGWAIEAFTGAPRPHGDLDLSIPRSDVGLLHGHLLRSFDVWQADGGALRPMVAALDPLPDSCGNLWLRRNGTRPWEYDVILMNVTSGQWTYKRDPRVSLPIEDVLWTHDGIRYLRPEVQLLHKAAGLRAKDEADFAACLPRLEPSAREWLRAALATAHSGHPWLQRL